MIDSAESNSRAILLVDDDDDVRSIAADMISDLGYAVIEASNAEEALNRLSDHPNLVLMVTDIRMPGMSGVELAELATGRLPALKVLLISGYFPPSSAPRPFLKKPFRFHELAEALSAEFDEG